MLEAFGEAWWQLWERGKVDERMMRITQRCLMIITSLLGSRDFVLRLAVSFCCFVGFISFEYTTRKYDSPQHVAHVRALKTNVSSSHYH
jgi:hypothetical protein